MSAAPRAGGAAMAAEMAEQPGLLGALAARRAELVAPVLGELPEPLRGVALIARGSSDHAAVYARYLLEVAVRVPVELVAPSVWTRYAARPRLDGHLALALSQSGRTPEIARVLELAGRAGARTIAITNDPDSPLAAAADAVMAISVGAERAVPATKTFTAQLLALAALAEALVPGLWDPGELDAIPAAQRLLLSDVEVAHQVAVRLARARAVVFLGGGYLYAIALEAALKLVETTSIPAFGWSASDVLHGPIAVAGPHVPVVCFAAPGPVEPDVRRAAEVAHARGADVIWAGRDLPSPAYRQLDVPVDVPEPLAPLVHAIRAQQLAYAVSRALDRDPDAPAGLQKITATT